MAAETSCEKTLWPKYKKKVKVPAYVDRRPRNSVWYFFFFFFLGGGGGEGG